MPTQNIYFSDQIYGELVRLAQEQGISVVEVVQRMVKKLIEEER